MRITRCQSDATTKHQRISRVAWIEIDGTIDGGDAHFIAIILNPAHNPGGDPAWMQDTIWQSIRGLVLRSKTEEISRSYRFGGNPDYIANHASNAGVRTTKWLNS